MLDAFLWWSGAIFWSVWIGLLLMALGNVILSTAKQRATTEQRTEDCNAGSVLIHRAQHLQSRPEQ